MIQSISRILKIQITQRTPHDYLASMHVFWPQGRRSLLLFQRPKVRIYNRNEWVGTQGKRENTSVRSAFQKVRSGIAQTPDGCTWHCPASIGCKTASQIVNQDLESQLDLLRQSRKTEAHVNDALKKFLTSFLFSWMAIGRDMMPGLG